MAAQLVWPKIKISGVCLIRGLKCLVAVLILIVMLYNHTTARNSSGVQRASTKLQAAHYTACTLWSDGRLSGRSFRVSESSLIEMCSAIARMLETY